MRRRSTPPSRRKWRKAKKLYNGACIACHEGEDGSGAPRNATRRCPATPTANPPTPRVRSRIILDWCENSPQRRASPNTGSMTDYAEKMTDQQIADVTKYIRNCLGRQCGAAGDGAQVAKARGDKIAAHRGSPGKKQNFGHPNW